MREDVNQIVEELRILKIRQTQLENRIKTIQASCNHLKLPKRKLPEEYMDICPDCGFVSYCYSI